MAVPATYATVAELTAYVGPRYTVPGAAEAGLLLRDASRIVDSVTLHRASGEWADPLPTPVTDAQYAVRDAACAQVEYWLELGVEYGVVPVREAQIGALSLSGLPGELAPKARRELLRAGLLYRGVETYG